MSLMKHVIVSKPWSRAGRSAFRGNHCSCDIVRCVFLSSYSTQMQLAHSVVSIFFNSTLCSAKIWASPDIHTHRTIDDRYWAGSPVCGASEAGRALESWLHGNLQSRILTVPFSLGIPCVNSRSSWSIARCPLVVSDILNIQRLPLRIIFEWLV